MDETSVRRLHQENEVMQQRIRLLEEQLATANDLIRMLREKIALLEARPVQTQQISYGDQIRSKREAKLQQELQKAIDENKSEFRISWNEYPFATVKYVENMVSNYLKVKVDGYEGRDHDGGSCFNETGVVIALK